MKKPKKYSIIVTCSSSQPQHVTDEMGKKMKEVLGKNVKIIVISGVKDVIVLEDED